MKKSELKKMTIRQLEKLEKKLSDQAWNIRLEIIKREKRSSQDTRVH
jgi:hypothetical protein